MTLSMLADMPVEAGLGIALLIGAVLVCLAVVALVVAAVLSILFSRTDLGMKIVWLIFVIIAPVIGALLWFLIGRSRS